jgi:PAS domain S-box-containing protein
MQNHMPYFLQGPGAVRGLLRQLDRLPGLGQPHDWPQALVAALSLALDSGFATCIAWGPESLLLYNDAYAQLLGDRHPAALGRPVAEAWPWDWHQLQPLFANTMAGDPVHRQRQHLSRLCGGMREVAWLDYSLAPVRDERGAPIGVCCTCVEVAASAPRDDTPHYRSIADDTEIIMWTTEASGYCTYLNPAWYQFTGQAEGDGLGLGWLGATHPEDRPAAEAAFLMANEAQSHFRAEYRLRRHDGVYRWVIDAAAPRFGEDGNYLGYVGAVLDINDRKLAEAAVVASNARFQAAIRAVEGILWTNDAAGRMRGEQPGWATLTGQSYEQYQDFGWTAVVHPDDVRHSVDVWHQAVAGRRAYLAEHRLRRRDGQWRHYSVRAIPTMDARGDIIEWVGVHTDITELRRTEDALRQLNAGLEIGIRQSTLERDRLWGMSQDIMAIASLNGYFLNVNPAFTAILGWSLEEAVSMPFLELTHPDHRADLTSKVELLARGEALVRYEVRNLHRDGGFRWLSWTIVPEGDVLYGVARDITAERRQVEILHQTEEALRQAQKMEAVGQLTGGIAHDFNNLLAGMVGNLELLKVKMRSGGVGLSRHIDDAMAVANRAAALTHRLLAFSRRQTLMPKPLDPNRLVAAMSDLIGRTVGPSVQVEAKLAADIWPIECDPNQLESVLLNLAINARDAMPGGGRLRIETANTVLDADYAARHAEVQPGDYVSIRVADNGTGMTAEVAARAFDPFFTTKPQGQGTGLGLSMIYGFAKQSGGHVAIDTAPGAGTVIRLKLPRYHGNALPDSHIAGSGNAMQAATQATLLLVDDEGHLRELLAEMLEMLNYRVVQSGDAAAALGLIDAGQHADLLITDVGLPGGMNGRQLAEAVRLRRPGLKVLFITGYAEDAPTRNGMLEPAMEVLTKPFSLDTFAQRVAAMLKAGA